MNERLRGPWRQGKQTCCEKKPHPEGGNSRNQTEEKANGGRRGGIQVTNTGMFAHTRNGKENLDQILTPWLEVEETAAVN